MSRFPNPKPFLETARNHQRKWLIDHLGCNSAHDKQVLLPPNLAFSGKNYFDEKVREAVVLRYPKAFHPGKTGNPKSLVSNALRSEHIPFNFFIPLQEYIGSELLATLMAELTGRPISTVDKVEIEYPKAKKNNPLGDNTAFDAYLNGAQGKTKLIIGVEVKYTEGPYGWGATEREMMKNNGSYSCRTDDFPDFVEDAFLFLANRHLKQIWRNFLLGLAMADIKKCKFLYVHLFPEGNEYQKAACEEFEKLLTAKGRQNFFPITYEKFLSYAASVLPEESSPWLDYLRCRYIAGKDG